VALVGESGSGKSTLVKLVPRFYDPDSGCVRLDERDLRQFQVRSLRRQIGFAMQGGALFCGTIRENLTFGRSIPDGDLEDATRTAAIHEFISALPAGYDTCLGEGGANLSEGQRQRLALARVLLLDTPILILDEPTSSLDAASEEAVLQAFRTAREGRTTLVIAHRPAMVAEADHVVVLADGRATEVRDRAAWQTGVERASLPIRPVLPLLRTAGRCSVGKL
jgi:ABC-type multidrug transport system fused ATPase/permease subunit